MSTEATNKSLINTNSHPNQPKELPFQQQVLISCPHTPPFQDYRRIFHISDSKHLTIIKKQFQLYLSITLLVNCQLREPNYAKLYFLPKCKSYVKHYQLLIGA